MTRAVSVIIVNYNTREVLGQCLAHLAGQDPGLQVIVVDNGSTDGSAAMVRDCHPAVELIAAQENKGLAAAHNLGLSRSTGDYVLFLGPDAFPESDAIPGLTGYLQTRQEVGIATCKVVLRDGSPDRDAHRGFPTPWTALSHFSGLDRLFRGSPFFDRYFMGFAHLDQPHEIDLCISHFMFVRRAVFDRVGKWDEDFFVYGEDVDFCFRARQAGWKIMYLPQWTALHYKGVSVGVRRETRDVSVASRETQLRMAQESTQAMRTFYRKHYAHFYPAPVNVLVLFFISLLSRLRQARIRE